MHNICHSVSKELKKRMTSLRKYIDWSEELRGFVENHIKEFEQERVIEELEGIIRKIP